MTVDRPAGPRLPRIWFPVWRFAHRADPYMASIRHILSNYDDDPDRQAVLIGSVFHMAQAATLAEVPEEKQPQRSAAPIPAQKNNARRAVG